ncbi:Asp23/Gls24 family envelope stress response protein [Aerococcaceae bacterium DSM 111176]|nr:Asp23/Gls24 family envelope stress response protein [Aerococcaceae bacterium DSM 111176]
MPIKNSEHTFNSISDQNLGDVNISMGVLETIASKAASEVDGVLSGNTNLQTEMGSFIGLNRNKVDSKVTITDVGAIRVDIRIRVAYSYSVPEIALLVQEAVKEQIMFMTDLVVQEVNIHVLSIETGPLQDEVDGE